MRKLWRPLPFDRLSCGFYASSAKPCTPLFTDQPYRITKRQFGCRTADHGHAEGDLDSHACEQSASPPSDDDIPRRQGNAEGKQSTVLEHSSFWLQDYHKALNPQGRIPQRLAWTNLHDSQVSC